MTPISKLVIKPLMAVAAIMLASQPVSAQSKFDGRMPNEYRNLGFSQNAPAATAPAAMQAAAQQQQIAMPPPEAMIIMIRSTVVALSHANLTNNYSVLNGLGSQNFRSENDPAKLAKLFEPFRSNKIDLAPVVYLTPQLNQQPTLENGRLRMVGFFPSQPMRVNFDLMFEPSEGIWKLFGIAVNLQRTPQAEAAASASQKQPQPAKR